MPLKDRNAQRAYQREWMARRRAEWLKENGPCDFCGSWDRLEIDHIYRLLKVSHRVWSWRPSRRERELAMCQVLCHACHQAKTSSEMSKPLVHGTSNAYKKKGCRCDECRRWRREYERERRAA